MALIPISKLAAPLRAACNAAVAVSVNSYSPYSGFCVGAALVHNDGSLTVGTNWENCTYQATCAERCAVVTANAAGKRDAIAIAVFGAVRDAKVDAKDVAVTPPCGLCRQMLYEVAQLNHIDLDVLMVARSRTHARVEKLSALLPAAFGPDDCGLDIERFKLARPLDDGTGVVRAAKGTARAAKGAAKSTAGKKRP